MIEAAVCLVMVAMLSIAAGQAYFKIASVRGPYAIPNNRSLHQTVIPRGAGAALAFAVLAGFALLWLLGGLTGVETMVFLVGGLLIGCAGYADDRYDIRPRYRILMQIAAVWWIVGWVDLSFTPEVRFGDFSVGGLGKLVLIFSCLWFFNLYNFVDGIDAMAASAAIFIGSIMGIILALQGEPTLGLVLGLLVTSSAGFLKYNWPPARMFMGDAGSSFISYILLAATLIALRRDAVRLSTCFTIFAFYFSDTTVTTTIRLLKFGRNFYKPHRSHAYQNLARVWQSHRKVVLLVWAINIFWVSPLTIAGVVNPGKAFLFCVITYIPLIGFALKFGPLFEDK